ncbi:MAG: hypothetical protein E7523_07570 [Ruminococcaceae bacterium]|nr:hypothetical protein [Oscillospiraceae bacterium]
MLFYTKNEEIYTPDKINPQLVHIAKAIIKTCHLEFKFKMKSNALINTQKEGKAEKMLDTLQKCLAKNRDIYDQDMSLAGVVVADVDDAFFADKDAQFYKDQLQVLIDFAAINTVVESRMFALMSAACEKTLGKKINEVKFFENQTEILKIEEEEETSEDAE